MSLEQSPSDSASQWKLEGHAWWEDLWDAATTTATVIAATPIGILEGVATYVWEEAKGLVTAPAEMIRALVALVKTGLAAVLKQIAEVFMSLGLEDIARLILGDATYERILVAFRPGNSWSQWQARGFVMGALVAAIAIALVTGGAGKLAGILGKLNGKLATLVRKIRAAKLPGGKHKRDVDNEFVGAAGETYPEAPRIEKRIRDEVPSKHFPKGYGKYHDFPKWLDDAIYQSGLQVPVNDGTCYMLRGTMTGGNGAKIWGVYNIIVAHQGGRRIVTHRDFMRKDSWSQRSRSFGLDVDYDDIPARYDRNW